MECSKNGKTAIYIGESSRSAYERCLEHFEAYRREKEASHMWKHVHNEHGGHKSVKFEFSVIKRFQNAMTRQISEAVRTRQRGEDLILNKKVVFNRCAVPELAVKFKSKMWEDEKMKFREAPDIVQTLRT